MSNTQTEGAQLIHTACSEHAVQAFAKVEADPAEHEQRNGSSEALTTEKHAWDCGHYATNTLRYATDSLHQPTGDPYRHDDASPFAETSPAPRRSLDRCSTRNGSEATARGRVWSDRSPGPACGNVTRKPWLNAGCRSCIVGERCWRSGHGEGRPHPPGCCRGPGRSRCRLQDREGGSPHSASTSAAAITRFGGRTFHRASARVNRSGLGLRRRTSAGKSRRRSRGAEPQAWPSVRERHQRAALEAGY